MNRVSLISPLFVLLVACDAGRPLEVVPGSKDNQNSEQAEVALGVSSLEGIENLVAAFQDNTVELHDPEEFVYNDDSTEFTRIRRGASLIGWSTSPEGAGWLYHGKIRGNNDPDSAAFLAGDPAIAVDPSNPQIVYVSSMMVSNRFWNEKIKGEISGDDPEDFPPNFLATSITGFCVAKSTDAGESFPQMRCLETSTLGAQAIDLTSIAVDAKGCVWLATTDTTSTIYYSRLYRSRPNATNGFCSDLGTFEDLTPLGADQTPVPGADGSNVGVYGNDTYPRVKSDHVGNIYFSTLAHDPFYGTALLVVRKYNVQTNVFEWGLMPSPTCVEGVAWPIGKQDLNRFTFPSGKRVRSAFPYDFAVGLDETGVADMRIAIHTQVNPLAQDDPQRAIVAFARHAVPGGLCSPATGWNAPAAPSVALGADAFQPVVTVRHGGRYGSNWFLGYLTTLDVTDPNKDYLRVEARALAFFKQEVAGISTFIPFPGVPIYLSSKSSWVCSTTGKGYWGDYFGLAYHRDLTGTMHVTGAFSSSGVGPQVCNSTPLIASPLHVESATF